ncbi:MAG: phage baseplate protein [Christensenellales bacterium]
MIINLKYNSQTGLLTPMANYTLAQHNHLADKIVVVSNAPDCKDYNYCLEFVCYNTKNVPKNQYVSEILTYTDDGIVFDVPNNLTQYAGFVDVQLTGYSKDNYNIIFKSISKNTKAFSVEGSLSVLDNALSDTPNILTLLQQELDYVREVKETIANDFENLIKNDLGQVLEDFEYFGVEYVFYDKRYSKVYKGNSQITPPAVELTEHEQLLGWVTPDGREWNFETDRLQGELTLIANVQSIGLTVEQGQVKDYQGEAQDVYVPYCLDGIITEKISEAFEIAQSKNTLYLPIGLADCEELRTDKFSNIAGGKDTVVIDGIFYDRKGERIVGVTRERAQSNDAIVVGEQVKNISDYAFCGATTSKIILPNGVTSIGDYAFIDCVNITCIELPSNIQSIGDKIFWGCSNGLEVIIEAKNPPSVIATSFALSQDSNAKVMVPYWAYKDYKLDENFGDSVQPLGDIDCIGEIQALQNRSTQIEQTIEQTDEQLGQVEQNLQGQIDTLKNVYAVGSIYMSVNSTSPASLFGGTWERIKDRFLLGSGDTYNAGATGGSATHTLSIDEMPSHSHEYYRMRSGGSTWWVAGSNGTIFTQEYINTNSAGNGQAHNNMPPYLAIYVWKRTA